MLRDANVQAIKRKLLLGASYLDEVTKHAG